MPAVTIRLTGELRPGRGDGRRGAGSGFGRQRPSTPTVVSGWERLAAVRLRSAATAAPAGGRTRRPPPRELGGVELQHEIRTRWRVRLATPRRIGRCGPFGLRMNADERNLLAELKCEPSMTTVRTGGRRRARGRPDDGRDLGESAGDLRTQKRRRGSHIF